MKALRKTRPEYGAEYAEVAVPEPGARDILTKVSAAAICGTDIHIYQWNAWAAQRVRLPMTFGHEFCGEVIKVGSAVSRIKPGDLVATETHVPDGTCFQCQTGN